MQISLYGDQCRALYINELEPRPEALQMAQTMVLWMVVVTQTWMQEGEVMGFGFYVSVLIGLSMGKRVGCVEVRANALVCIWCCGASTQLRELIILRHCVQKCEPNNVCTVESNMRGI